MHLWTKQQKKIPDKTAGITFYFYKFLFQLFYKYQEINSFTTSTTVHYIPLCSVEFIMSGENFVVQVSEAGERLDMFCAKKTGVTRSQIQKLIEKGNILVGGSTVKPNYKVKTNDLLSLIIPEGKTEGLVPEPFPLEIPYEDDHVVLVNKPAGMVVYPSVGHSHGTLMNALLYHCGRLAAVGGPMRPGVVHRLDKDTSGLMVIALTDEAYYNLVEQFRERSVYKRYLALIYGNLREDQGEITLIIGRSESDRKKMSTRVKRGREAVTRWKVMERFNASSLVEVTLGTGRTHQIRVHFASIGHPVLGDRIYGRKTEIEGRGKEKVFFPRQMLHAELLGFTHPATGEYLEFSASVPKDMTQKIKELRYLESST
jgi:23S rRNA pseudouridine1911/1915/1917 synthase